MPDLIREIRRTVLAQMKANSGLVALVDPDDIYPSTVRAAHGWPFVRWDGPASVPIEASGINGAEVTFMVHAFAKARLSSGSIVETAEDHCSRITSAIAACLHRSRIIVGGAGGEAMLRVASVRSMMDGAEKDSWHGIVNVVARCTGA